MRTDGNSRLVFQLMMKKRKDLIWRDQSMMSMVPMVSMMSVVSMMIMMPVMSMMAMVVSVSTVATIESLSPESLSSKSLSTSKPKALVNSLVIESLVKALTAEGSAVAMLMITESSSKLNNVGHPIERYVNSDRELLSIGLANQMHEMVGSRHNLGGLGDHLVVVVVDSESLIDLYDVIIHEQLCLRGNLIEHYLYLYWVTNNFILRLLLGSFLFLLKSVLQLKLEFKQKGITESRSSYPTIRGILRSNRDKSHPCRRLCSWRCRGSYCRHFARVPTQAGT